MYCPPFEKFYSLLQNLIKQVKGIKQAAMRTITLDDFYQLIKILIKSLIIHKVTLFNRRKLLFVLMMTKELLTTVTLILEKHTQKIL